MFNPLKVKEWLKFRKPDFEGFKNHLNTWKDEGIHFAVYNIIKLAESYNLPEPQIDSDEISFTIAAAQSKWPNFPVPINIHISKSDGE